MKIKADQDLRVFSHTSGIELLLPGTLIVVKVFPTRLEFHKLDCSELLLEVDLELEGDFKDFTVFQDLKKRLIEVQGFSKTGFFRYRLVLSEGKEKRVVKFSLQKAPHKNLTFTCKTIKADAKAKTERTQKVLAKKSVDLPLKLEGNTGQSEKVQSREPANFELLSLGMHKKLDYELLKRRADLKELLPLWFRLGQIIPQKSFVAIGTLLLLKALEKAVKDKQKNEVKTLLSRIFKTGFEGLFLPRLFDDQHQGLVGNKADFDKTANKKVSEVSSVLLSEGAKLIRALFFQEDKGLWKILPVSTFFAGRFINLKTDLGILQIEWTKKLLKKMILKADKKGELKLSLQRELSTFRLRTSLKEKGKVFDKSDTLKVEAGKLYFFDHFQK